MTTLRVRRFQCTQAAWRACLIIGLIVGMAGCAGKPLVVSPVLPMPTSRVLAGPGQPGNHVDLGDLIFDYNQTTLRGGAKESLQRVALVMKGDSAWILRVEGHADDLDTPDQHKSLGLERAKAVQTYLAGIGIEAVRLKTISYGDERRLCRQAMESCRQKNRRVHLQLVATQEAP